MKLKLQLVVIAGLILAGSALACEYKPGETKFLDYAVCLYGSDAVVVTDLPESSTWEHCIYQIQAFRPAKLLAVTREKDGKEEASINCRGSIGNPCYLMKSVCDAKLKAQQDGSG